METNQITKRIIKTGLIVLAALTLFAGLTDERPAGRAINPQERSASK